MDAWTGTGISLLMGTVSGLVGSLVWLGILRRVRPQVEISPFLVQEADAGSPWGAKFWFKMINRSKYAAIDLQIEMVVITLVPNRGGQVKRRQTIDPVAPPPFLLPGVNREDDNAFRMKVNVDVRKAIKNSNGGYIRIRVYARHEISGFGRLTEVRIYDPASEIKAGRFAKGQNFDVIGQ